MLDWSAATGAVIICPEYSLLPQHAFPVALEQVERVYQQLTGSYDSETSADPPNFLGFEVRHIAISGESTGGNLAAALCVKIGTANAEKVRREILSNTTNNLKVPLQSRAQKRSIRNNENEVRFESNTDIVDGQTSIQVIQSRTSSMSTKDLPYRMPDALMLSCPILDFSCDLNPSSYMRTNDPVLSTGLLSAISDAYLPTDALGISKNFPLASPIFASDKVLCQFPTTLIFASSTDPVLDDSVVFNQQLHSVGVQSVFYAAQNLPHAYLGLGTAGFPEAQHAQEVCVNWLNCELNRDILKKPMSHSFRSNSE